MIRREVRFMEAVAIRVPEGADPQAALVFVRAALAIGQPLDWQEATGAVYGEPDISVVAERAEPDTDEIPF